MPHQPPPSDNPGRLEGFHSDVVERVRAAGNVWKLPRGELRLPKVFGFCRGVERALVMLAEALAGHAGGDGRVVLLGQIIHNPWVNDYFEHQGVRILTGGEMENLESFLRPEDAAVVPAFGVRPEVERRLQAIGCRRIDTTCGNVRRLWQWVERAAGDGYGVLIFGRTRHDETIVTRSRLAEAGGHYVIVESLAQADTFCRIVAAADGPGRDRAFREAFTAPATNAQSLAPFDRLAQVSQTTMLYDDTLAVRDRLRTAFALAFSDPTAPDRLLFEPTVCRATQNRQSSAVELCQSGVDLTVVVGGFESSNTRHLYELAGEFSPAVFIEQADSILSADRIRTIDPATETPVLREGWLPNAQPLRIGVLAGASCPEVVVGQVLERLAGLLA
ncbi:MAG: 4-hydroxy-3-methylbut-2-enyl diphosphate reductase [Planctomycetota bacterium]|nr:4-hydroxy-3-methylbut-2-enyl diphosphate reductase [Planctomycetota bacterium]